MPEPSEVLIRYNGTDITGDVIWNSASFEMQSNAAPGTFQLTIRDRERTRSYITGKTIEVLIDGELIFGGFLTQISRTFAFPVVDTSVLSDVTARQIVLRGVSYNQLFDRLVAYDSSDYTKRLAIYSTPQIAGDMVMKLFNDYLDIPSGFTADSVDPVGTVGDSRGFGWFNGGQQGVVWRSQMEWLTQTNAAVFYIGADKDLHFHAPESLSTPWGFSDRPNHNSFTGNETVFTGATYGFREMEASEDINDLANDIFVWGGTGTFANPAGEIVFARYPDAPYGDQEQEVVAERAIHGRWQWAEQHFNEAEGGMGTQAGVDARAKAIAVGPTGSSITGVRGRGVPNKSLTLTWFAHDVPRGTSDTSIQHLQVGDVVTTALWVHGTNGKPLILTLPLRRIRISFASPSPQVDGSTKFAFVQFDGDLGISVDDPYGLWSALRRIRRRFDAVTLVSGGIATPDSTAVTPGVLWQGELSPTPDGTTKTFYIDVNSIHQPYWSDTTEIYLNGLRQAPGHDYYEDASSGSISFIFAPNTGDTLWGICRLTG